MLINFSNFTRLSMCVCVCVYMYIYIFLGINLITKFPISYRLPPYFPSLPQFQNLGLYLWVK